MLFNNNSWGVGLNLNPLSISLFTQYFKERSFVPPPPSSGIRITDNSNHRITDNSNTRITD